MKRNKLRQKKKEYKRRMGEKKRLKQQPCDFDFEFHRQFGRVKRNLKEEQKKKALDYQDDFDDVKSEASSST